MSSADAIVTPPIRLLVVDGHALFRDSVSRMLARETDFTVVGTAENAEEAIIQGVTLRPDVALMGILMAGTSCFEAIRIIRSRAPQTKFILVPARDHDGYLEQAIDVQAEGFIVKREGAPALVAAIRGVADGEIRYSPQVMPRLVIEGNEIRHEAPPKSRLSLLSPRERELLRVLARGLSLKDASVVLAIGYKTVDKQKSTIMAKLDIHDRVDLARFAIREGLVEP